LKVSVEQVAVLRYLTLQTKPAKFYYNLLGKIRQRRFQRTLYGT